MPEGDTIHRTAGRLRPALEGRELLRFEAPRLRGDRPRRGERIETVEAVGKHLLVVFGGGLTLHTHMRMSGSWHLSRPGGRWPKPAHLLRALVGVEGWEAVCFSAPVVQTFPTVSRHTDSPIAHLGPDLCLPDPDFAVCLDRMGRLDPELSIAEALLDQRVANGVGNVFKSEVLWACGVCPFDPVSGLASDRRQALLRTAARQLRANLGSGPRTTVAGGLAVYERRGRPCRRCNGTIRMRRHGEQARSTYWCPTCQPPTCADAGSVDRSC